VVEPPAESNMTTSHFSYNSYEQQPPHKIAVQEDDKSKLYRQNLDDIIKYIESDEKGQGKKRPKKQKEEVEAVAPVQDLLQTEETGDQTETKKKKRRKRKNRKRDKDGGSEDEDEEDELKIVNLEIKSCQSNESNTCCLTKLSDIEFDKSIQEFQQRL